SPCSHCGLCAPARASSSASTTGPAGRACGRRSRPGWRRCSPAAPSSSSAPAPTSSNGRRTSAPMMLASSRPRHPTETPAATSGPHTRARAQGVQAKAETRVETMRARAADLVLGASTDLVDRAKDLGADDARFLPAAAPQVEPVSAEAASAARARLAAEYGFDEGAVIVLAVGRVARQKNYPMLVRALGRLREAGDAESALVVLIAVAADAAVLAEVRTQYEQLGPASALPALHFLGARDDIAELAATADVYVLTSVWEARALVLQEALIAGKAIVATATGGSPELVGDAGLLVADDDDRALAEAVAELASDPARRAELGARARARAAQLPDEREVADKLVSLYTE